MAGFTNLYPNLPGFLVEFKDGGLALRVEPNPPATKSMLILGTAIDGPIMEPVAVDATTAELVFGKAVKSNGVPNGATLIPAFEEAWNGGCRDIRLMRISGQVATASIESAPVEFVQQKRNEEQLGLALGNDETELQLGNFPVISGTVVVTAKGAPLLSGFTVDELTGKVVIAANAVDAGSGITVAYDYSETVDITDETHTAVGNAITLTYDAASIASITLGGVAIDPALYTFVGKDVVFDAAAGAEGLEVKATYKGLTGNTVHATENSDGVTPFIAATSEQVIAIAFSPVPGTVHVYENGAEVLTAGAFTVDGTAKQLKLKKEFFQRNAAIEISYNYIETKTETPKIELQSIFGGDVYNQGTLKVNPLLGTGGTQIGLEVVITKPEGKKAQVSEEPLRYSSLDYPIFRLLVQAINNDAGNGVFKAVTKYDDVETSTLSIKPTTYFIGGIDGLNLTTDQLYTSLSGERNGEGFLVKTGAYQLLEDYMVDWIVPAGVFADSELAGRNQNFAYELAMLCAVLSYRNKTTLGAISLKPVVDTGLAAIQEHAQKLAQYENLYFMVDRVGNIIKDADGNPIDLGRFINVVAGPDLAVKGTSLGTYNTDGAVVYAAMNTVLAPQSAPTNKKVPGARGLRYRFSNAQLDAITARRLVTFKTKANGDVVVVDGVTAARPGSDYSRLTTTKVVVEVIDEIREVCDPYIGEPNTVEQRNAMSAAISKRLGKLKEAGVVQDTGFQVIATMQDQLLGQAKIELTIVPPQELRRITTVVSLKPSL